MDLKQKTEYWLDVAQYDLDTAKSMQQSRKICVHCIYVSASGGEDAKGHLLEEI